MGEAAGAGAGGASLATMALSATSSYLKGEGEQAADEYKASTLVRAAEVGKTKAQQTSADLTQRINNTLGNIDAIRAAGHNDPTSPTGAVVRDYQEALGISRRSTAVANIVEQSEQDVADAAYLRKAGKNAMLGGEIGAASAALASAGKTDFSKFGVGSS